MIKSATHSPVQRFRLAPTAKLEPKPVVPAAQLEAPKAQRVALTPETTRHAIGPELLAKALDRSQTAIAQLLAEPKAPETRGQLADAYVKLAHAVTQAEAALLGSLDGLDARVQPKLYAGLRDRAFTALRDAG
ncbi:MAG: hypothetical protein JNK82_33470, partial [Myxococcaceae bacterium]|nr:hypothetical protein [Myxococcaceae bacterium]